MKPGHNVLFVRGRIICTPTSRDDSSRDQKNNPIDQPGRFVEGPRKALGINTKMCILVILEYKTVVIENGVAVSISNTFLYTYGMIRMIHTRTILIMYVRMYGLRTSKFMRFCYSCPSHDSF